MPHTLHLTVERPDGDEPREVRVERAYNLGFTMRDAEKMQRHLDEVHREGVPMPSVETPPLIFPLSPWAAITSDAVEVQTAHTSGEVEIVTIEADGEMLVGVGSDHTDRKLESVDIPWAKQVTPSVLGPRVWRWEDVRDHWDQITIESTVHENGTETLYQRAGVAEFWTPPEMVAGLKGRVAETGGARLLFSGTVVSEGERLIYADRFSMAMHDPVLGRSLEHAYDVIVLDREITN
jgi:hypothetical protein